MKFGFGSVGEKTQWQHWHYVWFGCCSSHFIFDEWYSASASCLDCGIIDIRDMPFENNTVT